MKISNFIFRSWFYFRIGYSTYLAAPMAAATLITTVYYLAIVNIGFLGGFFTSFATFAVTAIMIGGPLAAIIGWVHLKRSPAWTSELDISVEANPYYYKLPPGYWRDAFAPAYLELVRMTSRLLERDGLLNPDEKRELELVQERLKVLIQGGLVGQPRRAQVAPA